MRKTNHGIERRSDCAVSIALEAIGDKWSLLVLRDLMFSDKRSYTELQSSEEGIATNILAARLVTLEANGLIRKTVDPKNGRRNLYYLTEKGIGLVPVVMELMHWMAQHNPDAVACSKHMKALEKNRPIVLAELTRKLRAEHLQQ